MQSFGRNKVKMFYLEHASKLRYYLILSTDQPLKETFYTYSNPTQFYTCMYLKSQKYKSVSNDDKAFH